MLLSIKNKFIFIHVWKAAGTSVRSVLSGYGEANVLSNNLVQSLRWRHSNAAEQFNRLATRTRFSPAVRKILNLKVSDYHCTAAQAKDILPAEVWAGCYKFSFVRNPWAREVSNYHFTIRNPRNPNYSMVSKMGSFDVYVREYLPERKSLQLDYLSDSNGEVLVDYIGKVENIAVDFSHVADILGIDKKLSKLNASKHGDYRRYYTDEAAELVSEIYRRDIEVFDYEF